MPSVGSVGDSYDNALAETINGLYKTEVVHRRPWRNVESVEIATLTWVDWFNNRRLLEPIGNIPPAEAEERYYATLDEQNGLWKSRGGSQPYAKHLSSVGECSHSLFQPALSATALMTKARAIGEETVSSLALKVSMSFWHLSKHRASAAVA